MKRPRAPDAPQGSARRWHIPPPLVHGPEPLEGGAVLGEVPGPLGLVLWMALRDVLLWAQAPPDERGGLFAASTPAGREVDAAADREQSLRAPLAVLRQLVRAPSAASPVAVGRACTAIAEWAEGRAFLATALAFSQNAALAEPQAAAPALSVARLAMKLGDHARAELWYRRSTGIARRARNWRLYAHSFSGLGTLYQDRGNLPAAQRFHLRALRAARRGGLRPEKAMALHDLFGVAVEAGRSADAERYAREALAAYSSRSPRLAALAHDVAYFWMEQGHFSRALAVFEAVAPVVERPSERLWVEADLMRAAAGAGNEVLARRMARHVREQCTRPELAAAAARAQLELARGELQMDEWDAADAAASDALRLAHAHREGRTALMAEALLDAIRTRRAVGTAPQAPAPAAESANGSGERGLAADLIRSLQGLHAATSPVTGLRNATLSGTTVNPLPQPEARAHR